MVHWEARVPPFIYQPNNFASNFVPTVETTRISYMLELLISRNNYVMLVGNTGLSNCCVSWPCMRRKPRLYIRSRIKD